MCVKCVFLGVAACCLSLIGFAASDIVNYTVTIDNDQTNKGNQSGVYFNKKNYIVTRYYDDRWDGGHKGDFIGCVSYKTNSDGHLTDFAREAWVVNPSITSKDNGLSGNSVAAAVYNGKIYAFYDYINPSEWKERLLYYKSSSSPSTAWEVEGGTRITVADTLSPGFGVGTPSLAIATAVLNDKLYVFYTHNRVAMIYAVVFDGSTWSKVASFSTAGHFGFNDMDAKAVFTDTGKEVIAIVGLGNYYNNDIAQVLTFDGANYHWSSNSVSFSWMQSSYVRIAGGSVGPGKQQRTLQIFGTTYGSLTRKIRRCEFTLPGDTAENGVFSDWSTADIGVWDVVNPGWCPLVSYAADNDNNLQQYISLIYFQTTLETGTRAGTYQSDYLKLTRPEQVLNTAEAGTELPSAWTLIGVIEGVPPFCLNGRAAGTASASSVTYGESTEKSVTTTTTYNGSLSASVGGKIEYVGSCCGTFTEGFKNIRAYTQTVTASQEFTWDNKGVANADGSKGILLVQKPTMTIGNYDQYASDKTTKLGEMNFTSVTSANLEYQSYSLADPEAGMKKRPKSSDYSSWYLNTPPSVNCLEAVPSLHVEAGFGTCKSSIKASVTDSLDKSSSSTVKIKGSVLLDIFKSSDDFTYTLSSKSSTTINQNISASITLDSATSGGNLVDSITITPFWLTPKDISKAYWIPTGYKNNLPWCLTWSVTSLSPKKASAASLDFNADGVQDVLAYVPNATDNDSLDAATVHLVSGGKSIRNFDVSLPDATSNRLLGVGNFWPNGQSSLVWFDAEDGMISIGLTEDSKVGEPTAIEGVTLASAANFAACGDFLGDSGRDEILLRNPDTGALLLCGVDIIARVVTSYDLVFDPQDAAWKYLNKGDFDNNGHCDILIWNEDTHAFKIIYLHGRGEGGAISVSVVEAFDSLLAGKTVFPGSRLNALGVGDFDGDGVSDVLFRDTATNRLLVALMGADGLKSSGYVSGLSKLGKRRIVASIGDFNNDGRADLLLATISPNGKAPKLKIKCLGPCNAASSPVKARRGAALKLGESFDKTKNADVFPSLD